MLAAANENENNQILVFEADSSSLDALLSAGQRMML